ncbi:type 4 pilus major pilin [Pseudomarimonas arenosa]|uniref:Type 4 secretion system PilS N-terminal domain-containing protein n=1 Tax=Pseudomarimonas arenosa TaxID=2774145 RepID=A0AAW3ZNH9_9GAMM|nr:type 4 pilus major pilin [Pseudomarimonas arenosa]MBD8527288.1 hypothetical protein [Pseudomarimonas arenosa]
MNDNDRSFRTALTALSSSSPAPAPLSRAIGSALHAHQAGYTLKEVMLGIGIASVAAAATYGLFFRADVAAQVRKETATLNQLATNINSAWGMTGTFEGLVDWKVEQDGLLPEAMKARGGMTSEWGTKVYVSAATINGKQNAGFAIEYRGLPEAVCARMATEHQDAFWNIEVDGVSVLAGGNIDTTTAIHRCADGGSVVYTYFEGVSGALAHADHTVPGDWIPAQPYQPGDPPGPGAVPPIGFDGSCSSLTLPPPQVRSLACEPGQQGAILETRTAACPPDDQGPWAWEAWTESGNTCAPQPDGCPEAETRAASCASGWSGQRTEQRHCVSSIPISWSAWYDIQNECVPPDGAPGPTPSGPFYGPQCVPQPPESRTVVDCPAGEYGSTTDQRDSVCVYTYQPATWGPWREISHNCSPCPADSSESENRLTPGTAPGPACPSGTTGLRSTETTTPEARSRTVSYDCPAGTGLLPGPTFGAWSPWTAAGPVTQGAVTGTCTPCPAAGPLPACPGGTTGVVTWTTTPGTDPTATTAGSCPTFTADYSGCVPCSTTPVHGSPAGSCPVGQQGSITWSVTPGTAPGSGTSGSCPTVAQVDTCAPCPVQHQFYCDDTEIPQYFGEAPGACPGGVTGQTYVRYEYRQSRQACTPASNSTPWGPWASTGVTCYSETRCPPPVCPSPQTVGWSSEEPCVGESGTRKAWGTRTRSANCPAGVFDGTWGPWSDATDGTSETCQPHPPASDPGTPPSKPGPMICPGSGYYEVNRACPPGQTGFESYVMGYSYIWSGAECERVDTASGLGGSFCGAPEPEPQVHCWVPGPLPSMGPGSQYLGESPYGGGWWFVNGTNVYIECP